MPQRARLRILEQLDELRPFGCQPRCKRLINGGLYRPHGGRRRMESGKCFALSGGECADDGVLGVAGSLDGALTHATTGCARRDQFVSPLTRGGRETCCRDESIDDPERERFAGVHVTAARDDVECGAHAADTR